MARKESVTKDIILETALALAKEEGIGNVTARKLAAKIGCSTQPIFRVYANMGELCGDINQKAAEVFSDYYENYESEVDTPFIHLGLAYIDFAKEAVIECRDMKSIYEVPLALEEQNFSALSLYIVKT